MNSGLVRLWLFIYGITILIAGALTLFIAPNKIPPFIGVVVGIIMTVLAYVYAEFQNAE